jgi:hypothetical protein
LWQEIAIENHQKAIENHRKSPGNISKIVMSFKKNGAGQPEMHQNPSWDDQHP